MNCARSLDRHRFDHERHGALLFRVARHNASPLRHSSPFFEGVLNDKDGRQQSHCFAPILSRNTILFNPSTSAHSAHGPFMPARSHTFTKGDFEVISRSSGRTALALGQLTTRPWSFDEDVVECARAGITRLGVWRDKLDDFGVERAKDILADHPVSVSSLSWAGGFTGPNGYSFDDAVHDTLDAIDDAAAIGARTLTIVSGPKRSHIHSHARRLLMEGLAATVDVAAERGVILALQPMAPSFADDWTFLHSLEQTLEMIEEFNHPYLGIAFGTYHLWDERGLMDRIAEAIPAIASVQLSDWRPTTGETDRLLPGEGFAQLPEIVSRLITLGYQGDFELDVWSSELWRGEQDELLRRCMEATAPLLTQSTST